MKKHKNNIILFLLLCLFYFSLGIIFTYFLNSSDKFNLFFGSDSHRVLMDLTVRYADHYRTSVHPLFVIMFQPIVKLLSFIIKDKLIIVLLLQSSLSAASIVVLNKLLQKVNNNKKISTILTIIFAISFSQIIFNSTIETYAFAQIFLILLIYYGFNNLDKKIDCKEFIILNILGVISVGITITNYFIYCLVILFLTIFKKGRNLKKEIINFLILILTPITFAIMLSEIQNVLFPNSSLFFKDNLYSLLYSTHAELFYVVPFTLNSIINQVKTIFGHSIFSPNLNLSLDAGNNVLTFGQYYLFQKLIIILIIIVIIYLAIRFFQNNYKKLKEHKFLILLLISFGYNAILHCFYGNNEGILYTLHYQFLLILIVGYLLRGVNNKWIKIIGIITIIIEIISNIIGMFKMYNLILPLTTKSSIPITIIAIYVLLILILLIFLTPKKTIKIIEIIFAIMIVILAGFVLKKEKVIENYNLYLKQVETLKKELNVKEIMNTKEKIYFFGMGNRKKLLYKNGEIYDFEKQKIIYKYKLKKEKIIPNEYMVLLETEEKGKIKIYENEESIFLEENNKTINLDETAEKINLPTFKEHKYSEILKVLHQEILFNIKNNEIIPNILVYDNSWYRDAFMASMVLGKTNNTKLIKNWVDQIDSIYDGQNGRKEADNLGELLYLLYVTNSNNKIKKEILKEIKTIENDNNYIEGYTDAQLMAYYPTALAKFALEKLGIENDLVLPYGNDVYARIVWFYDLNRKKEGYIDGTTSPYLNWAAFHTNKNIDNELYICDNLYPLSYEKGATFAKYNQLPLILENYQEESISPTHVWTAAEMFLLLIEY